MKFGGDKMKFDHKLAEFVGIMLGDGYISYPKLPRIKISLNSVTDKDYLCFVHDLLTSLFNTKVKIRHRKNENTSNLFIFNKKLIEELINEVGLVPSPKWNRAKIPDWILSGGFKKFVLRGYFDTDGCVVRTNNNGTIYPRLEMKISPSPMQEQFIAILKDMGFNFGVYDIGNGKVRIQINGKKGLKQWSDMIGFSNKKHKDKCHKFLFHHNL
mgnify:FL=1